MKRLRASYRALWENPILLFTTIIIVGGGAGLIWTIFTFKWFVFVRHYINVVLQGCVDALALIRDYPPLMVIIILFTLLLSGFLYSASRVRKKLNVNRLIGGGGQRLMAVEGEKDAKLNRVLRRIENVHGKTAPIYLIKCKLPVCLVQGLIKPRIVLSSSVSRELSEEELEAAILHEIYHLERKDPFKRLLAEAVADCLFFIPIVKSLVKQHTYSQELAADRFSTKTLGHTHHLASAIVKMAASVESSLATSLGQESLSERVGRLIGKPHKSTRRVGIASLVVSLVFIFSIYVTPFAIGAPMTATKNLDSCAKQCINLDQETGRTDACAKKTCGLKS